MPHPKPLQRTVTFHKPHRSPVGRKNVEGYSPRIDAIFRRTDDLWAVAWQRILISAPDYSKTFFYAADPTEGRRLGTGDGMGPVVPLSSVWRHLCETEPGAILLMMEPLRGLIEDDHRARRIADRLDEPYMIEDHPEFTPLGITSIGFFTATTLAHVFPLGLGEG